jgi:hypothetical protein
MWHSSQGWSKSRRCDTGGCVEVALMDGYVLMRDSKDPGGPVIRFSASEWSTFLERILANDFRENEISVSGVLS